MVKTCGVQKKNLRLGVLEDGPEVIWPSTQTVMVERDSVGRRGPVAGTCSHTAPVTVAGSIRTPPLPKFSLLRWSLNIFSSLFSSLSRVLQYRICRGQQSDAWPLARAPDISGDWRLSAQSLTSLSWGGSWCRSCLIRCFSPGLFTYGTLSSGSEL